MKILFTIIALFFSYFSFSQKGVDVKIAAYAKTVDTKFAAMSKEIDAKILAFGRTLDSIIIRRTTKAGTFNIDTLTIPVGSFRLYQVSITGVSGSSMASGIKIFSVSNVNGTYAIKSTTDYLPLTGITGITWAAAIVSNRAVVRITGTPSVKWEYKRMTL